MADLVLNEWLWSDLHGANGVDKQREAVQLLIALGGRMDRIVVVTPSAFATKFWYFRGHAQDLIQRSAAREFTSLYFDSGRCVQLEEDKLPMAPAELEAACATDDLYLVRAQQAVPGSIIVTTDQPLIGALEANGRSCEHRDSWIKRYLQEHGLPKST